MTEAENKVRLASGLVSAAILMLEEAMPDGSPELIRAHNRLTDARAHLLAAQRSRVVARRAEAEASK